MKAYPVELRERIVNAVDQQPRTVVEIAEIFEVSERYVYKLLKQRQERGTLAPLPHGGGARAKLSAEKKVKVVELVVQVPDATLAEVRQQIKQRLRIEVSMGTVWHLLDSLGLTRKKSPAGRGKRTHKSGRRSRSSSRTWRVDT